MVQLPAAAWFLQPVHPSPSRLHFVPFLLLPQDSKSLFAAPTIRFSSSAPALPRMPSRANPSLGRSLLPHPSTRRHRPAATKRSLSLPLLQQSRLPCRRTSNPAPVPAELLSHTPDPLPAP